MFGRQSKSRFTLMKLDVSKKVDTSQVTQKIYNDEGIRSKVFEEGDLEGKGCTKKRIPKGNDNSKAWKYQLYCRDQKAEPSSSCGPDKKKQGSNFLEGEGVSYSNICQVIVMLLFRILRIDLISQ